MLITFSCDLLHQFSFFLFYISAFFVYILYLGVSFWLFWFVDFWFEKKPVFIDWHEVLYTITSNCSASQQLESRANKKRNWKCYICLRDQDIGTRFHNPLNSLMIQTKWVDCCQSWRSNTNLGHHDVLKSANLLHKQGLDDSQSHTTVV